jgi:hypothetical protein
MATPTSFTTRINTLLAMEAWGTTAPPAGDTTSPVISITVPVAGATLTAGQQVTLSATATDNKAVTEVVFKNGATGQVLGTAAKNGNTYTLLYTPTASGPLTITATASDAAGNSDFASVTVNVQAQVASSVDGLAMAGQSNSSSLTPKSKFSAKEQRKYTKTTIWNEGAGEEQPLQLGVNEQGLNGAALAQQGYPGYEDGAGDECVIASLWEDNQTRNLSIIKPYVDGIISTNGSSLNYWANGQNGNPSLFDLYSTEFGHKKAYASSHQQTLNMKWLLWNQGEAEVNSMLYPNAPGNVNPDFVAQTLALFARFRTLFNNPNLIIYVVRTKGASNQYAQVGAYQQQVVAQDPNAVLIDVALDYLSDGVHTDYAGRVAEGTAIYNYMVGNTTPPPPTTYTFIEAEESGWTDVGGTWTIDDPNAPVYPNRGQGKSSGAFTSTVGALRRRVVTGTGIGLLAPKFGGGGMVGMRIFDGGGTKVFDQSFDNNFPGGGNTLAGYPDAQTPQLAFSGPTGAYTVEVYCVSGTAVFDSLRVDTVSTTAPSISSFTPTTASVGDTITLVGSNFASGATVQIGGVAATNVIVDSATKIRANVGVGAASGSVRVSTPNGTASKSGFVLATTDSGGEFTGPKAPFMLEAEGPGWTAAGGFWQLDAPNTTFYPDRGNGNNTGAYTATVGARMTQTVLSRKVGVLVPLFGGGGVIRMLIRRASTGEVLFNQTVSNDFPNGGNQQAGYPNASTPQLEYGGNGTQEQLSVEISCAAVGVAPDNLPAIFDAVLLSV